MKTLKNGYLWGNIYTMGELQKKKPMLRMEDYKGILRAHGIKGPEMAGYLGLTAESYRSLVGGSKGVPKWVKAFMAGYELAKKEEL